MHTSFPKLTICFAPPGQRRGASNQPEKIKPEDVSSLPLGKLEDLIDQIEQTRGIYSPEEKQSLKHAISQISEDEILKIAGYTSPYPSEATIRKIQTTISKYQNDQSLKNVILPIVTQQL